MPQVASDFSSVAANYSPPSPPRPAPAADAAPATPFESMLDDSAQTSFDPPPPAQPTAVDHGDTGAAPGKLGAPSEGKPVDTNGKAVKQEKSDTAAPAPAADAEATVAMTVTTQTKVVTTLPGATQPGDDVKTTEGKSANSKSAEGKSPDNNSTDVCSASSAMVTLDAVTVIPAPPGDSIVNSANIDATAVAAASQPSAATVATAAANVASQVLGAATVPVKNAGKLSDETQSQIVVDATDDSGAQTAAEAGIKSQIMANVVTDPEPAMPGKALRNSNTPTTAKIAEPVKISMAEPAEATSANAKPQTGPATEVKNQSVRRDQDLASQRGTDAPAGPTETAPAKSVTAAAASAVTPATPTVQTDRSAVPAGTTPPAPAIAGLPPQAGVAPAPQALALPLPTAAAVPLAGIAVEIAGKALAGKNRFEIRLDPPELGRIDVRLDVDKSGQVTSRLTVDRADTLDLLRRDAAGLERALQDAGLKTSDNGLQFSLRDQSTGREQANTPTPGAAQIVVEDDAVSAAAASSRTYTRYIGMGGGIDIRV